MAQNISRVTYSLQPSTTHLFTTTNNHNDYSITHACMYANVSTTRLDIYAVPIWTSEICYWFSSIFTPSHLFWTRAHHNRYWSPILNQQRFTDPIIEISYSLPVSTSESKLTIIVTDLPTESTTLNRSYYWDQLLAADPHFWTEAHHQTEVHTPWFINSTTTWKCDHSQLAPLLTVYISNKFITSTQ